MEGPEVWYRLRNRETNVISGSAVVILEQKNQNAMRLSSCAAWN